MHFGCWGFLKKICLIPPVSRHVVFELGMANSCALAHYIPVTVSSLHMSVSISIKGILCIIYTVIKYLQATFLLSPSRLHSAEIAVWKHAQLVTFAGIPHRAESLCCYLTGKHMHSRLFFFPLLTLNSFWQLVDWGAGVIVSVALLHFPSFGINFAL